MSKPFTCSEYLLYMFVSSLGRTENVLLENAELEFFVIRSRPPFMVLIPL